MLDFVNLARRDAEVVVALGADIERFLDALAGLTDPEDKRKIIGELFIRIFEEVSGGIEDGMAQMSAKFKEMGGQVYLDAEKVKESNRVL